MYEMCQNYECPLRNGACNLMNGGRPLVRCDERRPVTKKEEDPKE